MVWFSLFFALFGPLFFIPRWLFGYKLLGVAKRINESNSNRIINELGQNSMDLDSIRLLNELKFQDSDSIRLLNEYSVRFV